MAYRGADFFRKYLWASIGVGVVTAADYTLHLFDIRVLEVFAGLVGLVWFFGSIAALIIQAAARRAIWFPVCAVIAVVFGLVLSIPINTGRQPGAELYYPGWLCFIGVLTYCGIVVLAIVASVRNRTSVEPDSTPAEPRKPESGVGMAAFIVSLLPLVFLLVMGSGAFGDPAPSGQPGEPAAEDVFGPTMGLGLLAVLGCLVGFGLGLGGVLTKGRTRLFAAIGLVYSCVFMALFFGTCSMMILSDPAVFGPPGTAQARAEGAPTDKVNAARDTTSGEEPPAGAAPSPPITVKAENRPISPIEEK